MKQARPGGWLTMVLLLVLLLAPTKSIAQRTEFDRGSVVANQQLELQTTLEQLFDEAEGYLITGPLEPITRYGGHFGGAFGTVRVVCPDLATYDQAVQGITRTSDFVVMEHKTNGSVSAHLPGYRGSIFAIGIGDHRATFQVMTLQQLRYLIWFAQVRDHGWYMVSRDHRNAYGALVGKYLAAVDSGHFDTPGPQAVDSDLPDSLDLYAPDPDYVIKGYQNYKDFLYAHSELMTSFAHGITAFVPTHQTMEDLIKNVPEAAFPNKEAARIQEEYREFLERGGDSRAIHTLTAIGFDTLQDGEYFFAVGQSGKIRFGRELAREEVARLEEETGRKVPRANHAHLFPGESILNAGAFFIDNRAESKLVKVNAQSGHYFYSNVVATIREDISELSDFYLLTLGHFFAALERLGIPYDGVLISKL